MPGRKYPVKYAEKAEKDYWPIYGLQSLPANKFITIVTNIMTGKYKLMGVRFNQPEELIVKGEKKSSCI